MLKAESVRMQTKSTYSAAKHQLDACALECLRGIGCNVSVKGAEYVVMCVDELHRHVFLRSQTDCSQLVMESTALASGFMLVAYWATPDNPISEQSTKDLQVCSAIMYTTVVQKNTPWLHMMDMSEYTSDNIAGT